MGVVPFTLPQLPVWKAALLTSIPPMTTRLPSMAKAKVTLSYWKVLLALGVRPTLASIEGFMEGLLCVLRASLAPRMVTMNEMESRAHKEVHK